jgi:tetratricopeptide (TPR) repeat protein
MVLRAILDDLRRASLGLLLLLFSITAVAAEGQDTPVTFSRDVAPILFDRCAGCHQPGGVAPFSVLTYADVRPRADSIARAVRARQMPPWKPEAGYGAFANDRRLSDREVNVITNWARGGALEGNRSDLAVRAPSGDGWRLGAPDLVVQLPRFELPAGGQDLFRNFVVSVPGSGVRYVRGLEFHANGRSVHHANIFVDPTTTSSELDAEDPLPGYEGVIPYSASFPDGHFLGWTPGQVAPLEPADQAWRLQPGSSLLVQLHMMRGEEPQAVQPAIGLYFTSTAPTRTPAMLRLGRQNLDIAPGETLYVSEDSYVLPVDALMQAVQPHAHQRADRLQAWATLPDGSRRELLFIRQWDFAWQDQYRFAEPFWLPAGTRLSLRFSFDNSASNRRNPDSPPRRVVWGQRSSDEMADLWIQMLTGSESDLQILGAQVRRKMILEDIAGHELELRSRPDSVIIQNDLAVLYLEADRPVQAAAHFEAVSRLQPASATARFNLATALERSNRLDAAIEQYAEAIRLDGAYARARKAHAHALLVSDRLQEAAASFQALLTVDKNDADTYNNLGFCQLALGDVAGATQSFEQALVLQPASADAHYNLARAQRQSGKVDAAETHLRAALQSRPDWPPAMTELASLIAGSARTRGRLEEAQRLAGAASVLTLRRDADALRALALSQGANGRWEDAERTIQEALALDGVGADTRRALERDRAAYKTHRLPRPLGNK